MKVERLVFSVFGIVGIGMLVGCGLLVIGTREFLAVAKSTEGTVVRPAVRLTAITAAR